MVEVAEQNYSLVECHSKKMENVKVTFQVIPDGGMSPVGYHFVSCRIVFDIMMDNFHRKACLVMGGLHDLEVKAADFLNTYVMAPSRGKIW